MHPLNWRCDAEATRPADPTMEMEGPQSKNTTTISVSVWSLPGVPSHCRRPRLLLLLGHGCLSLCRRARAATEAASRYKWWRLHAFRGEERSDDGGRAQQAAVGHARVHVFKEVVGVASHHAQEVHEGTAAQHDCRGGEAKVKRTTGGSWSGAGHQERGSLAARRQHHAVLCSTCKPPEQQGGALEQRQRDAATPRRRRRHCRPAPRRATQRRAPCALLDRRPPTREGQQHPGQVGGGEGEDAQEGEVDVLVAPPPHVHLGARGHRPGREANSGAEAGQADPRVHRGHLPVHHTTTTGLADPTLPLFRAASTAGVAAPGSSPAPSPAPQHSAPAPPGLLLTIMKVRLGPRKWMFTQCAAATRMPAPKSSIHRKSAGRLRNDPSSRLLLYLTRKNMWKKKSRPAGGKGGQAARAGPSMQGSGAVPPGPAQAAHARLKNGGLAWRTRPAGRAGRSLKGGGAGGLSRQRREAAAGSS